MKKITMFGLAILAILVIAVPLAIAQGSDNNKMRENRDNERENNDSKWNLRAGNVDDCVQELKDDHPTAEDARMRNACVVALKTEEIKYKFEEKRNEIADKIMEKRSEQNRKVKNVTVKEFVKKREIIKEKLQEAEQKFQKAKEAYQNNKDKHEQVREEFLDLKHDYNQCRLGNTSVNGTNSTINCTEYEAKLLEKAKEDLLALADKLIDHLEKVKSRVEGAENINQSEANETIAKIDSFISQLNDAKALVEAADTKAELNNASAKIKVIWNSIDFDVFSFAERVVNSRVGEIYARSRALESQLSKVLDRLEAKGINTTELKNLTDSFREHLDNANDYMDSANVKFAEAKDIRASNITNSTEAAKAKLEEGKNLARDAHNELKEAHNDLMQLVKMINQKGESFDPDEINDDDIVEVSEPEDD